MPSYVDQLRGFFRSNAELQRAQSDDLRKLRAEVGALSERVAGLQAAAENIDLLQRAAFSDFAVDRIRTEPRYADPRCLNHVHGQVYSQNNEDGILAEIFRRIGAPAKTFVEIAAGDGIENTTRLLLDLGWSGLWIEGGAGEAEFIRGHARREIADGRLKFVEAFIDADGIGQLVAANFSGEPDLLSLDIDYNTAHVWKALKALRPRAVCIEYNAHFPPGVDFEVPYDPQGRWQGTTRFGASLKALERIGKAQGFSLVGCDIFGVNAFFVRDDLCSEADFLAPFTAERHYEPPRYSWVRMRGHVRHVPLSQA